MVLNHRRSGSCADGGNRWCAWHGFRHVKMHGQIKFGELRNQVQATFFHESNARVILIHGLELFRNVKVSVS